MEHGLIDCGVEGVFDVLYTLVPWFSGDADDIEACGEVNAVVAHVGIGGSDEIAHFLVGDSLYGFAKAIVFAGFHFDEYDHSVLLGNDVNFLVPKPPVSVANDVATRHEIGGCAVFADLSEFVVLGHRTKR